MYYIFFEAREPDVQKEEVPIVLWLQGGPGCSSMFGMLYINGPYWLNDELTLYENPHSWNHKYGMLFIDQPIGVGFSLTGDGNIPTSEVALASHVYTFLQNFYKKHSSYEKRPLYVTGESYAGKYVPSIAHYILQADAVARGYSDQLHRMRKLPEDEDAPVFRMGGLAIGNGFTDAHTQIQQQAAVAWAMGLIDWEQKRVAERMQEEIMETIENQSWERARKLSDELMAYIVECSGTATLEDIRRNDAYDAPDTTTQYLNQPAVKRHIRAADIEYVSCSPAVDAAMGHDVMKSTKHLVPDLLQFYPVLLYQGQFDAECGYAGNDAWISTMRWHGHAGFSKAKRELWRDGARFGDQVLGFWKQHENLTHVMIRNTGHMVPHDRPGVGQLLLEKWLDPTSRQQGKSHARSIV